MGPVSFSGEPPRRKSGTPTPTARIASRAARVTATKRCSFPTRKAHHDDLPETRSPIPPNRVPAMRSPSHGPRRRSAGVAPRAETLQQRAGLERAALSRRIHTSGGGRCCRGEARTGETAPATHRGERSQCPRDPVRSAQHRSPTLIPTDLRRWTESDRLRAGSDAGAPQWPPAALILARFLEVLRRGTLDDPTGPRPQHHRQP
jgi:hypothetical protein